jgi:hypothetical protein
MLSTREVCAYHRVRNLMARIATPHTVLDARGVRSSFAGRLRSPALLPPSFVELRAPPRTQSNDGLMELSTAGAGSSAGADVIDERRDHLAQSARVSGSAGSCDGVTCGESKS